jgi:hypothetical protein
MIDTTPTRVRWLHLTPGRFVLALLAVEVLLWLSERFGWLGWHKGYAVLTGVAVVGVAMLLMLGWFGVALVFRRRFQFSIRSLLMLVVVVALPCSWLAWKMKKARDQAEAVERIRKPAGVVIYDYEEMPQIGAEPNGWAWLRNLLGKDFLNEVVEAGLTDDAQMECLRALPQLEWLHLGCTAYTTDGGSLTLTRLSQYSPLILVSGGITDAGLKHLEGLRQLKVLHLDGDTGITDAGLQYLEGLTELQGLDLENTGISDTGLQRLEGLPQLQGLDLGGTQITDGGVLHLEGLTRLQRLGLSGTEITDMGLKRLKGLNQLEWIYLGHTEITDAGLQYLEGLTTLKELDLTDTKVTDEGVAKLQQALPNCKIAR